MAHYYEKTSDGLVIPRHFVQTKSGGSRPTRSTDVKKWTAEGKKVYPSVTTILGVLDKAALNNWKVDQHLKTAYECPVVADMTEEDYLDFIKRKTQDRLDLAPKAGTDCHLILENYFLHNEKPQDAIMLKICENVRDVLSQKVGTGRYECEKYFVNEEHGYAGCADLIAEGWVIDYKTKQEAAKFKPGKMAYPEHTRQLGAYCVALERKSAANIFICLETGEVDFHPHEPQVLENGWLDFKACIGIFNRSKGA